MREREREQVRTSAARRPKTLLCFLLCLFSNAPFSPNQGRSLVVGMKQEQGGGGAGSGRGPDSEAFQPVLVTQQEDPVHQSRRCCRVAALLAPCTAGERLLVPAAGCWGEQVLTEAARL